MAQKPKSELFGVPADELFGVPEEPALPGPPRPPLPDELKPDSQQAQSFITSPHGLIRSGLRQAVHGLEAGAEPGINPKIGAASQIIRGLGTAVSPAGIPLALANPMAAIGALGAGALTGAASRWAAGKLGGGPEVQDLAEDVGNIGGGIVGGGPVARGLGRLVRSPTQPLVRAALSIPAKAKAWGAEPEKFALENTTSLRPAGIAAQAGAATKALTAEQDAAARAATAAGVKGSLAPARRTVESTAANAEALNSRVTPPQVAPLHQFLNDPTPTFRGATEYPPGANTPISFAPTQSPILGPSGSPIPGPPKLVRGAPPPLAVAEEQSPTDLLGMRRQLNKDFTGSWSPTVSTKGQLGVARRVYHDLGNATDKVIPGGAARDDLIQSGITLQGAAESAARKATLGQRVLSRISRPTGGLFPALIGYHTAGPLGAAAAITGAEAAASPEPLMAAARWLQRIGGGPTLSNPARVPSVPMLQRPVLSTPLLMRKRPGEE